MVKAEASRGSEEEALKYRAISTVLKEEGLLRAENGGRFDTEPLEITLGSHTFPDPQEIVLKYNPNGFPEAIPLNIDTKIQMEISRTTHEKNKRTITRRRTYIRSDGYFATVIEKSWKSKDGSQLLPPSPVFEIYKMDEKELKRVEAALSKLMKQAQEERKWDEFLMDN